MTADEHVLQLPPRRLRPGGSRSTDELWVQRGLGDARMLVDRAGLSEGSRVLDWGSGPGRLLAGIHRLLGPIQSYIGIDVKADVIEWATANLASAWTTFAHVDQHNERYNAAGEADHLLPLPPASIDIVCAFSVFTHMRGRDVAGYSAEMGRLLRPGGIAVPSAFVEFDVPPEVENPEGYPHDRQHIVPVMRQVGCRQDIVPMGAGCVRQGIVSLII